MWDQDLATWVRKEGHLTTATNLVSFSLFPTYPIYYPTSQQPPTCFLEVIIQLFTWATVNDNHSNYDRTLKISKQQVHVMSRGLTNSVQKMIWNWVHTVQTIKETTSERCKYSGTRRCFIEIFSNSVRIARVLYDKRSGCYMGLLPVYSIRLQPYWLGKCYYIKSKACPIISIFSSWKEQSYNTTVKPSSSNS